VKLDSDENPETTREYGVMSMPTLIVFRDGEVVSQVIGAHPKTKLRALIDDAL
jgi:thioredoxin 1